MLRIKICGITNVADALAAADAGADAIGLNFFRGSKRCVDRPMSQRIAASLPLGIKKIGVVVNADTDQVRSLAELVPLDVIQLHGDEQPELMSELPRELPIIRAHRCSNLSLSALTDYLARCVDCGRQPDAVLVDGAAPDTFGGTGQTADWNLIARERDAFQSIPLILAGGLTPDNVAEAIRIVQPHGVDVASGVESAPGKKDVAKVREFVAAAREAFTRL